MSADLASIVLLLRPERPFAIRDQFLGRMAHKMFFLILSQSGYADLALSLHKENAAKLFTVSDIFQTEQGFSWMRITSLTPDLSHVLLYLAETLPGQVITVPPRDSVDEMAWPVGVFRVDVESHDHPWAAHLSYEEWVQAAWRPLRKQKLTLEFMSPTVLKSVGVFQPFPAPGLVLRLLYERLCKIEGLTLAFRPEPATVEALATYLIEIDDYAIECGPVRQKDDTRTAFQGWITYRLLAGNADFERRAEKQGGDLLKAYQDIRRYRDQCSCLLNLLGTFAFYSGVGVSTAQGMGMVRMVVRHG